MRAHWAQQTVTQILSKWFGLITTQKRVAGVEDPEPTIERRIHHAVWIRCGRSMGRPTIDITGAVIANPTPVPFGALQDISLDFSWTMKELYGQYQMPLAVGRGAAKVTAGQGGQNLRLSL